MDIRLRIFLFISILIGIYLIIRTLKTKKLSIKYGMYLTILFLFLLTLILFPSIIETIAAMCGFKEAPNMLFLISIFILFYIAVRVIATLSKLQDTNKKLVQELSILKNEIKKK